MRFLSNRRKNEDKEKTGSVETEAEQRQQSQDLSAASSTLQQACREFGRDDLEEALSWVINLEPRGRDIPSLLDANDRAHYSIAANVKMYEGNVKVARDYFKKSLELSGPNSHWRKVLEIVMANLDDTVKIAQRYWELNRKGKISESKEPQAAPNRGGLRGTSKALAPVTP
jgi:hypothetical protein